MPRLITKLAVLFLMLLLLSNSVDQTIALATAYDNEIIGEVEDSASYLNYKIGKDGARYAIYLNGPSIVSEPAGELYNGTHTLWFTSVNVVSFDENTSIDVSKSSITKTQITTKKVFPYNYNFQIDSQGRVHVAFISNYTLYYTVRDLDGTWTETALNDNKNWLAYGPDIQLGENEQPRIMYVASYQSGASAYFYSNDTIVNTSYRAIHYALLNETDWFIYDTSMNNKPGARRSPGRYLLINPGFLIDNGMVYAAYNVDNALSSSSGMEFTRFSEYPDEEENTLGFDENKFPKLYEAAIRSTKFRRPRIMTIDQDIVMLVGTWGSGGGIIAYLANISATPVEDVSRSTKDQWDLFQIENARQSQQIEGFTGILDRDTGTVIGIYSVFHEFNEAEGLFNYDVLQLTFRPSNGLIGDVLYARATDSNNVYHTYPNIAFTPSGAIEIAFIRYRDGDQTRSFLVGISALALTFEKGGGLGMIFAILAVGGLLGGWVVLVNKLVKPPELEEEILPHMINLKDSITKD